MKNITNLIGILLIIAGLGALAYQGFTYTKHESVAQIVNVQITADTQKTVYLPPIFGGTAIVVGIFLIVIGRESS